MKSLAALRRLAALAGLVAGLWLWTAVPVSAQSARFEISPYLGYRFGGNLHAGTVNQPTLPGLEDLTFKEGLNLGLAGTVRLHEGILMEVFGERMGSKLEVENDTSQTAWPPIDVDIWYVHAGVNWEVNNSYEAPLRPLVGISLGATVLDPGESDRSSEARFSVGILLGVKYFPGDTFGFRLHGRFLTTYLANGGTLFESADGSTYTIPETTYMSQFDISAGVVFPIQ